MTSPTHEALIARAELELAAYGVLFLNTTAELIEAGIDPESIEEME